MCEMTRQILLYSFWSRVNLLLHKGNVAKLYTFLQRYSLRSILSTLIQYICFLPFYPWTVCLKRTVIAYNSTVIAHELLVQMSHTYDMAKKEDK